MYLLLCQATLLSNVLALTVTMVMGTKSLAARQENEVLQQVNWRSEFQIPSMRLYLYGKSSPFFPRKMLLPGQIIYTGFSLSQEFVGNKRSTVCGPSLGRNMDTVWNRPLFLSQIPFPSNGRITQPKCLQSGRI